MVKYLVTQLVVGYRFFISPWTGSSCRFQPSCSEYCLQCLERFSVIRAMWLTVRRISRCHPWSAGGSDPVPPLRH